MRDKSIGMDHGTAWTRGRIPGPVYKKDLDQGTFSWSGLHKGNWESKQGRVLCPLKRQGTVSPPLSPFPLPPGMREGDAAVCYKKSKSSLTD